MKRFLISLALLVLLSFVTVMPAYNQDLWIVPRIDSEITFDGIPDENVWQIATPFPMVTHSPVFGNPPSEKSDIRLCFDDNYLYMGGHLYYNDIRNIQTVGKKRDFNSLSSDWFGISIDTYNDKENALLFFTNPNGTKWDATVKNDGTVIEEAVPINVNWNSFWDSKVSIDDNGWHAELRIPMSSLRYQDYDNIVIMGISVYRWMPYINESVIFPAINNNMGYYSNVKSSLFREAEFKGLTPRKPLYLTPYLLTGFKEIYKLNDQGTNYIYESDFLLEPGLDLKYGLNSNTTLDLTVNTDFAQVEADDQQFNLTRFSLFYEEKRVFFLERASIFDFNLGGTNTLFYSRKIGLYEGEPVRIWGGARLISRTGKWDVGFLDMQTASHSDLPSENFAVFRAKRNVINKYSYMGSMLTSRIGIDGTYNMAYGLDGVIRIFGDDYITLRWAQTFENDSTNNPFSLDPSRWMISWQKRKNEGFTYDLTATYSGTQYNPGIGFQVFDNYWLSKGTLKYTWISPEESRIQNHSFSTLNYNITRLEDGALLTFHSNITWEAYLKEGHYGTFSIVHNYELLPDTFHILEPVLIPDGKYRFLNANINLAIFQARPFKAIINLEAGEYYDGLKVSPQLMPTWNVSSGLELGGIYRYDYVNFSERKQKLSNHIIGLRFLYMLNIKISFSAFVQYNTAIDQVISNFRFRYNPREGSDLYVVFNEGRNTYLERETPLLPSISDRSVMVKYTYTFEL